MCRFLFLLVAVTAAAQTIHLQNSHTSESLRGVSAVSRQIAWASGTHGTYLRTLDGGSTWTPAHVPGAESLDFRGVIAFSPDEAFLMSSGPGEQSRIYHTTDAGGHWQLQFTNTNPKGFFDSIDFWNPKHGVILGDPIPDDNGTLKFEVLLTADGGEHWRAISSSQLPEALPGEGAFAASNSCIAILPERPWKSGASAPRQPGEDEEASAPVDLDPNIWFATGGTAARVFHSGDRGQTWEVLDTPILHGVDSAGVFSIAFRNRLDGVIAGGDYKRPKFDGPNLALTHDGGKTWKIANIHPQAYFSAAAYEQKRDSPQRLFLIGPELSYDFHTPKDLRRIPQKGKPSAFNAIRPFPGGGVLLVGAKGVIAVIP